MKTAKYCAIVAVALALLLAGCAPPLGESSLVLSIGGAGGSAAKILAPVDIGAAIADYDVILYKNSTTISRTIEGGEAIFSGLEAGDWTVTVEGRTLDDGLIARGETSVTVAAGATSRAVVNMALAVDSGETRTGTIQLEILIPSSIEITSATAEIDAAPSETLNLSDVEIAGVFYTQASYSINTASGSHLLWLSFVGSQAIPYLGQSILVYPNITTHYVLVYDPATGEFAAGLPPPTPTGVTLTGRNFRSLMPTPYIVLSWTPVPEVYSPSRGSQAAASAGYEITKTVGSGVVLGPYESSYSDPEWNVYSGTVSYMLRAFNRFGESDLVTLTMPGWPAGNISVTTEPSGYGFKVTWDEMNLATAYKLYVVDDTGTLVKSWMADATIENGVATAYVPFESELPVFLTPSKTYWFSVTALIDDQESVYAAPGSDFGCGSAFEGWDSGVAGCGSGC